MKTCKNLLRGLLSALLLTGGLIGCQEYDIPAANTQLSYPAGETALGAGVYLSGQPTVRAYSKPEFAITGATHNAADIDAAIATIDPATGIISVTPASDLTAMGDYLFSVSVTDGGKTTNYPNIFKLVVKGIVFEETTAATTRGEALTIPVKSAYFAQQEGTVFKLVAPESDPNDSYKHFSIDSLSCAVTVDATANAGIYPISIKAKNRTNPDGTVFANALTIVVESKPYDLRYTPSSITLMLKEGHTSPQPTVRAASVTDGEVIIYSLGDDFGIFTINTSTGVISLPEDLDLATTTAKTYNLNINTRNAKGTTLFAEAYSVTIDPNKKAEPITAITYPDLFPVALKSGQPWTSQQPSVTGSTVGIVYSLPNAPAGVSIDAKTGIITLDKGHKMPMLVTESTLEVNASNQGMETPCAVLLGFSIDPSIWKVKLGKNFSSDALTNSGITNMDRISFLGKMWQASPMSIQIKLGWGISSTAGGYIDANGGKDPNNSTNVANQNNDWLISEEILIDDFRLEPTVKFTMSFAYGTADANLLDLYIVEINAQNVYTFNPATDQEQSATGTLDSKPSNLPWQALMAPIVPTTTSGYDKFADYAFPIPDNYKGKKVRIALRYHNPAPHANNARTYRFKDSLRIEDQLPTD